MKIKLKPILYFVIGSLTTVIAFMAFSFRDPSPGEATVDVRDGNRLQYKWYTPELPQSMSFAGERVPLERQDIREQFEREVLNVYYNQNSLLYILKLSTRYFPTIEKVLKKNGVPDDFKYLCVAESALRNQTSSAGAVGFWQFMAGTAPRYGLEVSDEVDQRYDITQSTEAACQYFKTAFQKFGTWTGAAASYNCGMGGYNNFVTYQHTDNYYNLLLPDETMRYVFRILAFKYLMTEANKMGFILLAGETYKPYKTYSVTITSTIPDLAQYALDDGITYRTLKILNPWLRDHSLTVKGNNTYQVLLPTEKW